MKRGLVESMMRWQDGWSQPNGIGRLQALFSLLPRPEQCRGAVSQASDELSMAMVLVPDAGRAELQEGGSAGKDGADRRGREGRMRRAVGRTSPFGEVR